MRKRKRDNAQSTVLKFLKSHRQESKWTGRESRVPTCIVLDVNQTYRSHTPELTENCYMRNCVSQFIGPNSVSAQKRDNNDYSVR